MQRRRVLTFGAAGIGATGLTLFVGWWQVDGPGAAQSVRLRPLALSGMNFRMVDHEGTPVTPQSLVGRATMVFFGFTYCPDVCPTTLSDISLWLDDLGNDADELNVVFITVDPERDTVDAMTDYVSYFHPAIRGWVGVSDQIAQAADDFRATYEKVPMEDGDYTMNHTASVFLFNPTGEFVSTIDYHEQREFAVPKIRRALKSGADTTS
ncbi:SCO family protein [Ruegeria sp. R14_0]|uniref:SCO family protein n=1 Tax=Ruegeria sp. R14_0 TaxID=2821100 RepID=UPI001ADAC1E1|nr:SCO family protein [Ruegeria sp. R14_0]MBO9448249.1 SCO family protein [Ruegeria sp. R14_0]